MNQYLNSKPRYEILDGLRGVAAIIVVLYHLIECYPSNLSTIYFAHGYLAVDFFFALSGFVIGYAYDDRWNKMSLGGFFKRRIVRLHPMVIFGALVGIIFFYYSGGSELFNKVDDAIWWMVLLQAFLMILMIPLPSSMDIRGWGELTSINGPIWSLMYEYVANILYALVLRHLPKYALGILLVISAVMTTDLTLNLNLFGMIEPGATNYTLIGGFVLSPEHLYIGFTRLLCPFLTGLLLCRIGKRINIQNGFGITTLIVIVMLCMPIIGGKFGLADGLYQLLCVLVLFPLILAIGAGSTIKGERPMKICKFLGDISYPLYITHYPIIYMHTSWKLNHLDAPLGTHIMTAICTLVLSILIAWATFKLYDQPVREWLTDNWLKRKPKA